jgi:hypothetical protein
MQKMIPMPSPKGTNFANAWIVPMKIDQRTAMAFDQYPSREIDRRNRDLALEQNGPNGEREKIISLIAERLGITVQKAADLIDAAKEKRTGEDDERVERLHQFLTSKGLADREARAACDIAKRAWGDQLNKSALAGGSGGALHSQIDQPARETAARDQPLLTEELLGCEPIRGGRGDSALRPRLAGDARSFEAAYGLLPTYEATQPRRRVTDAQLAMDAAARDSFARMFPTAMRIRNYI